MLLHFLIGNISPKGAPAPLTAPKKASPSTEEKDLLSAAINGSQRAYSLLVSRHRKMVFTIALNITANREEAEEALQDTFLKAFRYLPGYRGDSSFKTWLYRIARTTALDHLRRKRLHIISSDIPGSAFTHIPDSSNNSLQAILLEERSDRIKKAIGHLCSADQAALQLFYFHDQSIEEISTAMGWTSGNTKSRLSRARQRLSTVLGEAFRAEVG